MVAQRLGRAALARGGAALGGCRGRGDRGGLRWLYSRRRRLDQDCWCWRQHRGRRGPPARPEVGLLREDDISTKKFRELTNELARLLAYEATADFPLEKTTVQCWSGPVEVEQISGKKVTVVPILRAGLGMLDGVLDMIPSAKVSVVGLSRNHETLQPEHYFERLVGHLDERTALIAHLKAQGIASVFHYLSLHKSPYFAGKHDGRDLANADRFTDCLLRLPMYAGLGNEGAHYVADAILNFYAGR